MSATGGQANRAPGPRVACVLVTWNGWEHTDRCLGALLQQEYMDLAVLVVDNGSKDGTADKLRWAYPSVICIENGYNAGFARACNVGARAALERGAEYLWFLNNDTEAPPGSLTELVRTADADAHVGVVGAVLFPMESPARVQAWGGGQIDLLTGYNRHYTRPATLDGSSYITFASALVRRHTFEELGGLWEEIFMYFEDSDFCLRATGAGWRLAVAKGTAILHAEGGSGARRSPALQQIQTRSGMLFLRRHGRVPVFSAMMFLVLRVGKRVMQKDWAGLRGVLHGALEGLRVPRTEIRRGA